MELNWTDHKEQLDRQLKWQATRNSFYGNLCYHDKNNAAHERAFGHLERRAGQIAERGEEIRDGWDFYHQVVLPHDQKIKQAQRDGDAGAHRAALDEANAIIREMGNHTHLALEHDNI